MTDNRNHVATLVLSICDGMAEPFVLTLANRLAEGGHRVDLVLTNVKAPYRTDRLDKARLLDMIVARIFFNPWLMMRCLQHERPKATPSALSCATVIGISAYSLARVSTSRILPARAVFGNTL